MHIHRKGIILTFVISCLVLSALALLIPFVDKEIGLESTSKNEVVLINPTVNPTPLPYDPKRIEAETKTFVERLSEGDERYKLVAVNQTLDNTRIILQDWILLTIVSSNIATPPDTGIEGLVALGHVEDGRWDFRLVGDKGFDDWLNRVPDILLSPELKEYFRLEKRSISLSALPPRQTGDLDLFQLPKPFLPWPAGKDYILTNGPGGGYHQGRIEYAQDWGIPTGHEISAILPGKVVEVVDKWGSGDCDIQRANQANFLRLEIEPGLRVLYLHLGEVRVVEGQTVEQGQIIALSGDSGFTCNRSGTGPGAHLHIVLEDCRSGACNSQSLNFAEFGGESPIRWRRYTSQNDLPEVRRAKTLEAGKNAVQTALNNFYLAYRCGQIKDCDETKVTEELKYVTEHVSSKLFPDFCFFCQKNDALEEVPGKTKYVSFPDPSGDTLRIRVLSVAKVTKGKTIEFHYTATNVDLLKEGGKWKVDDWEITCGFITNETGKVIQKINLEGCEWKLETSQSGSSP